MNKYGVQFPDVGAAARHPKRSGPELLCQLKDTVSITTLTPEMEPFVRFPWATQLPPRHLSMDIGPFKTCAVVSSAGSMKNSGLGKEIGKKKKKCIVSLSTVYLSIFSISISIYCVLQYQHKALMCQSICGMVEKIK